ncbi:hypothetical protein ABEB36_008344 [Hypothenemus hampei]|uniref:Uncharacterized protein n=1 Tax=Hypothenemus hampei TaxID=57062 RepID=A0ABD1EQL6_HYPHA
MERNRESNNVECERLHGNLADKKLHINFNWKTPILEISENENLQSSHPKLSHQMSCQCDIIRGLRKSNLRKIRSENINASTQEVSTYEEFMHVLVAIMYTP